RSGSTGKDAAGQDWGVPRMPVVPDNATAFSDVPPSYWAARYVNWATRLGLNGYAGGKGRELRPDQGATRGQAIRLLVSAAGWPLVSDETEYSADVSADNPLYGWVETAAVHGLVDGTPCGGMGEPCDQQQRPYFRPASQITRAAVAKLIVLATGWPQTQ